MLVDNFEELSPDIIPNRSQTIETNLEQPSTFPDTISELHERQNSIPEIAIFEIFENQTSKLHLAHQLPGWAGLVSHEGHPQDLFGHLRRLFRRRSELDATSLATPTRVNLCLHDNGAGPQLSRGRLGLTGSGCQDSGRHRYAEVAA